jgi:hypothetical protein
MSYFVNTSRKKIKTNSNLEKILVERVPAGAAELRTLHAFVQGIEADSPIRPRAGCVQIHAIVHCSLFIVNCLIRPLDRLEEKFIDRSQDFIMMKNKESA